MKIRIQLLYCIFPVLCLSCGGKDCHKHMTCPPEFYNFTLEGAKDYFWAEKGSFWIYKNTLTNELDTHFMMGYKVDTFTKKGTYEFSNNVSIKYERMYSQLYSTKYNWNIYQETNSYSPNTKGLTQRVILTRYIFGGDVQCFFYPFDKNIFAGSGSYTCRLDGFDSILNIQNIDYSNVVRFVLDRDPTWGNNPPYTAAPSTYYWAKNVGLIRKFSTEKPENWELVEYKIVR